MFDFDPDLLKEVDDISQQYESIHDEVERIWAQRMVFTLHWWLDVALAVLPWILWIIVHDKKKTLSLLYAGLFTMFIATVLDMAGVSQGGWNYNTWLLPFSTQYLPWDWTVMPVASMLFYQYWPSITGKVFRRRFGFMKSPWAAGVFFGVFASYIVEPIFAWLGVYEPSGWEHHYSLPIYFAIYMAGYWLYAKSSASFKTQGLT